MIRSKIILCVLACAVLCSLTITDTHHLFIEQEEIAEGRELEREELKEKEEGKDWNNLLSSSGGDATISDSFSFLSASIHQSNLKRLSSEVLNKKVALFILYCNLKIDC